MVHNLFVAKFRVAIVASKDDSGGVIERADNRERQVGFVEES